MRASPSESATEQSLGTIKKGNDGNKWIILENLNKVKKWIVLDKTVKKYDTIDNGARPFRVIITKNKIIIFKLEYLYSKSKERYYINETIKPIVIKKYKNVFIGKNIKKYSYYSSPFTGNTILVEIKAKTYLYVGEAIKLFHFEEPIIKYVSIMGNNDVPYPFALTKNYAILLIEDIILERNFGDIDPYQVYYNYSKKYFPKYKKLKTKVIVKRPVYRHITK